MFKLFLMVKQSLQTAVKFIEFSTRIFAIKKEKKNAQTQSDC